jgi:hypothetical protein
MGLPVAPWRLERSSYVIDDDALEETGP